MQKSGTESEIPAKSARTYGEILRSTVIVGGSSVAGILIRIVRTKAMAFLLGPAGFGLFGIFGSIESLAENIAGMGVSSSGVRQIAEAVGLGDQDRIAKTIAVLRRTSIVLGLFGSGLVIALSSEISWITFGNRSHTSSICLLSLAVLFQVISYGQDALVQGMRRIKDLARMNVLGALYGTVVSVPVIYFLRDKGVVLSLVIVSGMMLATSTWYSRQFKVRVPSLTFSEVKEETVALMKLGSVFMIGTLLLIAVAYIVRTLILRKEGLHAAGLYQSAWTLGGLYVGLIIQSMAADFYPRLTAAATDNRTCNRLVNEQVRVGMLLACPGVIATISLAPIVTAIFYSAQFAPAVAVLRWICLGTMLQVITWPMGFIIVAKGKKRVFFYCELACALTYAALAWLLVDLMGLSGAGIAFFGYCIFHGLLHYPIVNRISGFQWSSQNIREGMMLICFVSIAHVANYLVSTSWAAVIGSAITLICALYSIRVLAAVSNQRKIPKPFDKLLGLAHRGESPTSLR